MCFFVYLYLPTFCCMYSLLRTVVSDNDCLVNNNCSASLVHFSDLQMTACSDSQTSAMDVSTQSLNCVNNINCVAMICDKDRKSCYNCFRDFIQGLEFPKSWTWLYLKRNLVKLNTPYNQTNGMTRAIYPVPSGLMPGDVICLKATLITFDILQIELVENVSSINYYFTARCIYACFEAESCSSSSCTDKNVVIDSYTNGQGSGSSYISTNYPFVLNQVFTVFFHMRPSSVDVYINRTLYKSFLTSRPPQVVRSIRVQGTAVVHELSF